MCLLFNKNHAVRGKSRSLNLLEDTIAGNLLAHLNTTLPSKDILYTQLTVSTYTLKKFKETKNSEKFSLLMSLPTGNLYKEPFKLCKRRSWS